MIRPSSVPVRSVVMKIYKKRQQERGFTTVNLFRGDFGRETDGAMSHTRRILISL